MPLNRSQVPLLARQLRRILPDESCSAISCAVQGWQANVLPYQRELDDHALASQKRAVSVYGGGAINPSECSLLNTNVSSSAIWAMLSHARGVKTKVIMEYYPLPEPKHDTYTTEPTNYLQLLGAVTKAENTDRLKHLIQSYGATFDHVILAAAFRRLPQIAIYKASDLKQAASLRVPISGDNVGDVAAASMSVQIPRPGARPRRSYQEAASRIALQLMAMVVGRENVRIAPGTQLPGAPENQGGRGVLWRLRGPSLHPEPESAPADTGVLGMSFLPKQSAACVAALGALYVKGVPLDPKLLAATITVALDAAAHKNFSRLQSAEARDMVLLLKGLSQLRHIHVPQKQETIRQLIQLTVNKVHSLTAVDVQTALRSFVSLGIRDDMLLDTLAARAIQVAKDFPPVGIASVLKSLALATPHDLGYGMQAQRDSSRGNTEPMLDNNASNTVRQQAVEVLSAGLVPQVVLMSGQDIADMAVAIAGLGKPIISAQSASLNELSKLPAWLENLVKFLADKATRDIDKLQPSQLAAVLDMLVVLNTPHPGILQSVVNGILAEHQLDASLRAKAAASALDALAVLAQHVHETDDGHNSPYAPKQILLRHAVAKSRNAALEKRETAAGLGNLPIDFADPGMVVGTAFGPLQGMTNDPATGSRQQYQRLLSEWAPWNQRVAFAMERLLQLYVQPAALNDENVAGLAKLCHAVKAVRGYIRQLPDRLQPAKSQAVAELGLETLTSMIFSKILTAIQQRLQDMAQEKTELLPGLISQGGLSELRPLLPLMQDLRSLHMTSAQLSAAVALHLKSLMSQNPSAGKELLPVCIPLLEECSLHNAEPMSATKEAAQMYVRLWGVSGRAAGDPWPEHTASGLAPTTNRSARKPWDVLRPDLLAKLLKLCAANDALDSSMMTLVSEHITHTLTSSQSNTSSSRLQSVADSELDWMVTACRAYISYGGQQEKVSQPVSNAADMLVVAIADRVKYASSAQREAVRELHIQLSGKGKGSAPVFGQLLGRGSGTGLVNQQTLARLANSLI